LVAACGFAIQWFRTRAANVEAGPVYQTEELERGDLALRVTATGKLAPTNQVTVGSELSGTAAEVFVDTNDSVKKGQPLAQLDTAKLDQQAQRSRARLLSAQAKVSQAKATVRESAAAYARLEELHRISGGKTPSQADMEASLATVERAKADAESADASVSEAEADLRTVERDLQKTVIRSPVNGIVLTRSLQVGQTVAASFTAPELFTIAEDLSKMELVVAVAEADIGSVAKEQPATFTVDAWPTRTYHATVTKVSFGSLVTNNVVTYNTELAVNNDDLSLRPGMTATAEISVAERKDVFLLPNAALRFDPAVVAAYEKKEEPKKTLVQSLAPGRRWSRGLASSSAPPKTPGHDGPRVWTLRDGKPVEIPVTVGISNGSRTEATGEGLVAGMPIITSAQPPAEP
jgi:HlyD family secretion protein